MLSRRAALATLLVAPFSPLAARAHDSQAEDPTVLSVAEASRLMAAGTLTPIALTDAYLGRITQLNGALGAYITVTADRARTGARRAADSGSRGLLRGLPITHKDLFETAGIRTTGGSRLFASHVPSRDAAVVTESSSRGPTVPVTALPIEGPIDGPFILRNTWPFNAARTPAISIPCGTDPAGLPAGLQIASRPGDDDAVLRAARLFEGV